MASVSRRFNASEDFLTLGKKLQTQTEELDRAVDSKARHTALLLETRRALDIARTQLHDIKQRNLLADAEACSFEARADRVANEVLVRSHEEKNLQKEVVGLKRELHITQMEVAELRTELEFELTAKEHTTDLIARAQMELQAQIHERDFLRKEEYETERTAASQRDRLAIFRKINKKLLDDIG